MATGSPPPPAEFLYLASPCYGGLAQVRFLRSVLALRGLCAKRGVALQLDLGGGEALLSRALAGMLAKFLASEATHLLFVEGDADFDAHQASQAIESGDAVEEFGQDALLVSRDAARRVADAHPDLRAGLGDVRSAGAAHAIMVFESVLEPRTGTYLTDLAAFVHRWRNLAAPESAAP